MGQSDYGLPIYVCVLNGAQDSLKTFEKARQSTSLMINNGIHPGEPDGINACLIWIEDWIAAGKSTKHLPVIGIIPSYNVGEQSTEVPQVERIKMVQKNMDLEGMLKIWI